MLASRALQFRPASGKAVLSCGHGNICSYTTSPHAQTPKLYYKIPRFRNGTHGLRYTATALQPRKEHYSVPTKPLVALHLMS